MPLTTLPDELDLLLAPLWQQLPLHEAMSALCPHAPAGESLEAMVQELTREPLLKANPALAAGLWLYVDDLNRSHRVSQKIETPTGSYWHGIMHRREGDFSNSHYWFNRVGEHPALVRVGDDYDPHAFVDAAAAAQARHENPGRLIELQRREWAVLFAWCARQAS